MQKNSDDVSNIHNRFSLTLINPSSHYFSLVASLIVAAVITVTTYLGYLDSADFWFRIPLVVGVLAITQLLDTRFTKKKEYSKSLHVSLFANLLWIATLLMGLLASFVLSKELEQENNHEKQQEILKSINLLLETIEKMKKRQ